MKKSKELTPGEVLQKFAELELREALKLAAEKGAEMALKVINNQ